MIRLVAVAILAPVVLIGLANVLFAPRPGDAELVRCDLVDIDSPKARVEASLLNRSAGWLWETFRVRVVVEGLEEPVVLSSSLETVWRGTTAGITLVTPSIAEAIRPKVTFECLLFVGQDAVKDRSYFDPWIAVDRRHLRPGSEWDKTRRIVFISGMGTNTETALGTFEQMTARFPRLLGARADSTFVHFSYAGRYQLPASAAGPPLVDFQDDARAADFVAADVCQGAAPASRQLRTLLENASPLTEFVIIGHSFGGFVASHFLATLLMEDPDGSLASRIHSVMTLDSPVAGYPYAPVGGADNLQAALMSRAMGCGDQSQAARDVIRGSEALARIALLDRLPRRAHYVTIGNSFDLIVPAWASHAPGSQSLPLDSLCFEFSFHGCVLRDPRLIERLAEVAQRPWVELVSQDDHGDDPDDATTARWDPLGLGVRANINEPGRLERPDDRDVFRVSVLAGRSYLVFLAGNTNVDAHLRLLDGLGNELDLNDDSEDPTFSELSFEATQDGDVFVEVTTSPLQPSATGPYLLGVFEFPGP